MSRISATDAQIQEAYTAVRDDPQWSESCRLIAEGKPPSEMFRALAVRPDILQAMSAFSVPLYPGGLLERNLKERVVVAVSEANDCQYCAGSHSVSMRRAGLFPDDALTPRESVALAYTAAAVANPPAVTDTLYAETRTHFDEGEIIELTMLIGLTAMLNRLNDCLGVRYNNDYDE